MSEYECYESLRILSSTAEAFITAMSHDGPNKSPVIHMLSKETRDKLDDLIFATKEAQELFDGEGE